ncbi:hypothetical protein BDV12DRAFT_196532 [Aspergillus spectabilis]
MAACGAQYSLESDMASQLHRAAVACYQYQNQDIQALQCMMIMGAFAAWTGSSQGVRNGLEVQSEQEVPQDWQKWIKRESLKRTTFCIFTLTKLLTIAYDIPSLVTLERRFGLLCEESQWCARNVNEWMEITRDLPEPDFRTGPAVIERLCNEALPAPRNLGMFGCHVVISSLVQQIILLRKTSPSANSNDDNNSTRHQFYTALKRWRTMWENEPLKSTARRIHSAGSSPRVPCPAGSGETRPDARRTYSVLGVEHPTCRLLF